MSDKKEYKPPTPWQHALIAVSSFGSGVWIVWHYYNVQLVMPGTIKFMVGLAFFMSLISLTLIMRSFLRNL